mgnify:CR=1 FL=1
MSMSMSHPTTDLDDNSIGRRSRVQRATSWGVVMRASGPVPCGGAISATWRPTR